MNDGVWGGAVGLGLGLKVDPAEVAAFAGAGVKEDGGAAGGAVADVGAAVGAALVVATVDGEAGWDAVDPAEDAFGVAVGLHAAGGFAEKGAGHDGGDAAERGGWQLVEHGGVEAAMNEGAGALDDPGGRLVDGVAGGGAKVVVKLGEGGLKRRVHADAEARQGAAELAVVVAEDEQATAGGFEVQHHADDAGAVRAVIAEVA